MEIATITSEGQTTIPKTIREYLHLRTGHRITFVIDEMGQVTIRPLRRDVSELKGFLKPPQYPVTLEKMDEVISRRGGESC